MARVLVIDDDERITFVLSEALTTSYGHEVITATSGWEGIKKALAFNPDAIICDLAMKPVDGYEVARALSGKLKGVRLIAITGYDDHLRREAAKAAGYTIYFGKPVGTAELNSAISGQEEPPCPGPTCPR